MYLERKLKLGIGILLMLLLNNYSFGQEAVDSIAIPNSGNYILERKRELAKSMFVIATLSKEKMYSVKFDSKNSFGIRFWIKEVYKHRRIKNKKGKWVEYQKKDYTLSLINLDCSNREYEIIETINYDGKGNVKNSIEGDGNIAHIAPNSIFESFSELFCY